MGRGSKQSQKHIHYVIYGTPDVSEISTVRERSPKKSCSAWRGFVLTAPHASVIAAILACVVVAQFQHIEELSEVVVALVELRTLCGVDSRIIIGHSSWASVRHSENAKLFEEK